MSIRMREQLRQIRAQLPGLNLAIDSCDNIRDALNGNPTGTQPFPDVRLFHATAASQFGLIALAEGQDLFQRLPALVRIRYGGSHSGCSVVENINHRLQPS